MTTQTTTNQWWRRLAASKKYRRIGMLVLLALFAMLAYAGVINSSTEEEAWGDRPVTRVRKGPLTIKVVESGSIKPRKQIILKNETGDPAALIYVAEEGSHVKKGELVFEFDTTQLENDIVERRIRVRNDEADLIGARETLKVVKNQEEANVEQAQLNYKFAQQDLKKYEEGEYPKLLNEAKAKITLAEAELKQAEEDLKWSEILYKEKYLSESQYQQDQLVAQRRKLDLELAEAELELLKNYTYDRQMEQLKSDVSQAEKALERAKSLRSANIAQAEAELANREAELKEEQDRLARDERRLENARVTAPIDGTVLYATSVGNRWRRNDEPIDTGTVVDEEDEVIYLPTASEFNVEIKIPEVDLSKIETGMPVRISVDALPDVELNGVVTSIASLPDVDSRFLNPNLKLYDTVIEVGPSEAPLRNGMSALAEIEVEQYENVVYVPIQSVVRVAGIPTVYLVEEDGTISPRSVKLGLDNSRFVHIRSGLEGGELVLLAPPLQSTGEAGPAEEEPNAPENAPAEEPIEAT